MKVKELRDKSIAELNAELSSLLKAHLACAMQRATSNSPTPANSAK
jgi:ribosomal protein L29